ncbi:PREDICTED: armadillo repeat-containing protein 10-like [Elephantulus edwardii]|uniref:armadillo repeat-containing protein 10-like n=1 Tax=Elephantulus edwardii TaxID=28737 RepID=UPI0003F0E6AB|nr:PREDICTED: armadillo repeat-containing protein 10-like [Elephantulus edwardii]
MGGARDVGWVTAGLVLGAGACYCLYLLARARRRPSRSAEDLTNGLYDESLSAEQLQKLLYLLDSTEDPAIIERALVTLGNNAAFSANHIVIRELGGIPIVGNVINSHNYSIKEKALNTLNNLTVNVENQEIIKVYVNQVLDSSFLSLYDGHVAKEILLRVLTLFQNLNDCIKMDGHLVKSAFNFHKGSLYSLLYGQECAQKMRALVHHPDVDVKEKVVIIT